ncbi:heparinase II/III-family protein [Parapedobacter tibetensis]|uniref:heparinase II/III-family protein n=1 Tax=Parapedobacter tibetensis TaxID=2972951 RepID=UPI00214D837D|nr:heparinase II/III-family protein [Parapedobacter tibetensis]
MLINQKIKRLWCLSVILTVITVDAVSQHKRLSVNHRATHPVFSPDTTGIIGLKRSVATVMDLSVDELIGQVPDASGIFFVGCPNCHGGAQEMGVLSWKSGMGDQVRCNYCDMLFPNEHFPNNGKKLIIAPSGKQQVYRYHEDANGRQYFFEPHAWYDRWTWIQTMADQLARLWFATRDNAYGDRAAAIVGRFAQLYPDYAIRYDYPHAPVKFFPADQKWPYKGVGPYRGAKWSWWGYMDIPVTLAMAYDVLQTGYDWRRMDAVIGPGTDQLIEKDLLRLGYEFTTANPEVYTNMSPRTYQSMIRVGRVLGDPSMVHEAVKRFREFVSMVFFDDGWWKEGTPSYHDMTINGVKAVADALAGYTDPPGWKGERFENFDPEQEVPVYKKALAVSREAVMPNGRKIPINDTWWHTRGEATDSGVSHLWPSLGNAVMGVGTGEDQVMLNVNWSGDFGHSHDDNGSIILFAAGQELLSDIGYTHTRYRGWTVHTASHNTVVINQRGQDKASGGQQVTGKLLLYDDKHPHVKVIDVDASPAYASAARAYRRQLLLVHAAPGRDYVVDRFDVEGGHDHDWFLHGMCEEEGTLETSITLDKPLTSLVPAWGGNNGPKTQYDTDREGRRFHAYWHLRDVLGGQALQPWTATWRYRNAGLRTHLLSPDNTQVFRFRTPSVRRAGEDGNKLDDFFRQGLMQRHSGGKSTFLAIHEPFRKETWISGVQKDGNILVVRYILNGTAIEDRITLGDGNIRVSSSAGWDYQAEERLINE